ncbi:MAG: hypothetical protein JXL80_13180 [Planctomycetes bacterium]|nr:hypothetical protein [Planctomycetota bacterium]
MKRTAILAVAMMVMAMTVPTGLAWAQAGNVPEPDPAAYCDQVIRGVRPNAGTGEQFCWYAAYSAETFLDGYEAFGNPKWLEAAEKFFDFYLSKLQKDPDGYEGWIGDPISEKGTELATDAVVGDAVLCAPLVRFAEIVQADSKLKSRFGAKAKRYVDLATRICWDKWNRRDCYYEDAAGWGSYHTYGKLVDVKTNKWVDRPSRTISENLNKHYSVSIVLLRLWRVTGKPEYRERVLKVYGRAKTMWRYYPDEDRIVWNFWMPHGPYDIEGSAPKSWVGVHSSRPGYQAGETADFVEVYDSGLVYEREDLQRMIRTNHWMIAAGKWRSADGTTDAGQLWPALARFDPQIRAVYEKQVGGNSPRDRIALAYLRNVTDKLGGWKRRYVEDEKKVEVVKVPLDPGRNITMSVIIPNWVETANNDRVRLACQTRAAGSLKIELLDKDGSEVLGTLHEIDVPQGSEYNAPLWDGTNPKTGRKDIGQYTIRWTLAGESRQSPVWVKVGKRRAKTEAEALEKGQTLTVDFESKLDSRWHLEGAVVSSEQKHGGRKSLKVDTTARLAFGEYDDLPVRITMWVYDSGQKFGKQSTNGPAWGIVTANGDKFCLRQCWRGYLGGDQEYAWVNTGENQWFSPHPSGVRRGNGWVECVFDFTDPAAVKVTGNGQEVRRLTPKYTPKGAVAIYLLNEQAGPLFVDDIKIEYPK